MLEDELRRTFAGRVEATPSLADPATTAIRRARRIRRRRSLVGGAAAAVAVVMFGGGLVWVQDWRLAQRNSTTMSSMDPTITSTDATADTQPRRGTRSSLGRRPGVDLFAEGYVWTAEGGRISVADRDTPVTRAYRVALGWVLGGTAEARLVRTDGVTVPLSIGERWILSSDGIRVAYVLDGMLRLAELDGAGVKDVARTQAAADTVPVAFAGDQVIIGEVQPDGRLEKIDRWYPSQAAYQPNFSQYAYGVYSANVGGVVAQVPGTAGAPCLVRLAVGAEGVRRASDEACGIGVSGSLAPPVISPDGRWLAVPMPVTVAIYDLMTVFRAPIPSVICDAAPAVDLIWESSATLLASTGATVVRCGTTGTVEPVALPSGLPDGWRFVPSHRPSW